MSNFTGPGTTNSTSSNALAYTPFGFKPGFGTTPSSTSVFGPPSSSSMVSPSTPSLSFGVVSSTSGESNNGTSSQFPQFGTVSAFGITQPLYSGSAASSFTFSSFPISSSPATSLYGHDLSIAPFSQPAFPGGSTSVDRRYGSDIWNGFTRYSSNSKRPFFNSGFAGYSSNSESPFCNSGNKTWCGGVRNTPYAPTPDENCIMMSISAMPAYYGKSHEELRWDDIQLRSQGLTSSVPKSSSTTNPVFGPSFPQFPGGVFSSAAANTSFSGAAVSHANNKGSISLANETGQEQINSDPYNPFSSVSRVDPFSHPCNSSYPSSSPTIFSMQDPRVQPSGSPFQPRNDGSHFSNGISQNPYASWPPQNKFVNTSSQTVPITSFSACQASESSVGSTITIRANIGQRTTEGKAVVCVQFHTNNNGQSNPVLEISTPYGARIDIDPVNDPFGVQQAKSQMLNLIISTPREDNSSFNANGDKGKETISLHSTGAQNNHGNNNSTSCQKFHLTVPDLEFTPDCDVSRNLSVEIPPKLQRSDYYTEPAISELLLTENSEPGFMSHVNGFVIGRQGYGQVQFEGETDVRRLDLDSLIEFNAGELMVYMEGTDKPPVGQGLNKPALVTLANVKCINKNTGEEYVEGERVDKYKEMLKKVAEQKGAQFVSYDPVAGEWKFSVEHF